DLLGSGDPACNVLYHVGGVHGGTRVERHDVACGLILVSQSAPHQHQAFRRVCHLQHGEIVAPPDAEVFGFDDIVGDASVTQLAYAGVGRYADLVHAVFGTDDKHVLAAQRAEYVQHDIDPDGIVDPQQLIGGGSGVGQWP